MTDLGSIIDQTSAWPCFTPGMHWALSDNVFEIGRLKRFDLNNDCIEYEIDLDDLPLGDTALHKFNAIRNFVVYASDMPKPLAAKAAAASMCIGSKAVEQVPFGPTGKAVFTLFSGSSILPLFVMEDQTLTIRIHFKDLTEADSVLAPRDAVDAQGLLVKIKRTDRPFFVAGCDTAVVTYDGCSVNVIQNASGFDPDDAQGHETRRTTEEVRVVKKARHKQFFVDDPFAPIWHSDAWAEDRTEDRTEDRSWPTVDQPDANFMDMWQALQNGPQHSGPQTPP